MLQLNSMQGFVMQGVHCCKPHNYHRLLAPSSNPMPEQFCYCPTCLSRPRAPLVSPHLPHSLLSVFR
jgi:hypothetical protein